MNILTQLIRDEGKRNLMYKDSLGIETIGVGRLIDADSGESITE